MHILSGRRELDWRFSDITILGCRLLLYSPGRHILPTIELPGSPGKALVCMTKRARIRNLVRSGHRRRNEAEGVAAHVLICKRLFNLRHMACNAFPAGTARFMVRMFFNGARVRSVRRTRAMAFEAHHVSRFDQQRRILSAMDIMATETLYSTRVHHALDKIIALHAVLMRGSVREIHERCFSKLVVFQLPEILQSASHVEPDGPIVVFAFDWVLQRLSLRMALDTGIVRTNEVETRGIDDVCSRGMRNMQAPRPVASLTADIPFGYRFRLDVVIHRMAAIAKRTRGPLEVVRRIQGRPPVRSILDEVWPPDLVCNVPLGRQYEVVITNFFEIALLPSASVHQGDVILAECNQRIGFRKIRQNGIGMLLGIPDYVRHAGCLPAIVDLRVTGLARERSDEVRGARSRRLRQSSRASYENGRNDLIEAHRQRQPVYMEILKTC